MKAAGNPSRFFLFYRSLPLAGHLPCVLSFRHGGMNTLQTKRKAMCQTAHRFFCTCTLSCDTMCDTPRGDSQLIGLEGDFFYDTYITIFNISKVNYSCYNHYNVLCLL